MPTWKSFVRNAAHIIPLNAGAEGLPSLAVPIDSNARAILRGITATSARESFNALYVEDLLRSCMDRLKSCLDLRERAQELEIRAMSAAMDIDLQEKVLTQQRAFDALYYSSAYVRNDSANGFVWADNTVKPTPLNQDYWDRLREYRGAQVSAAQETLELRRSKHAEPGNPANFAERYEFLYDLFARNLQEAYKRALACRDGLEAIYDIVTTLPFQGSSNFLNELVIWAQESADHLDEELDGRVIGELGLAVSATSATTDAFHLLPKATYESQLASMRLTFVIPTAPFDQLGMRKVRLRSMRIQTRPAAPPKFSGVWPLKIKLPREPLVPSIEFVGALAVDMFRDLDNGQAIVRGVHNRNPIGEWEIVLPPTALDGGPTSKASIANMFLYLRVSYEQ